MSIISVRSCVLVATLLAAGVTQSAVAARPGTAQPRPATYLLTLSAPPTMQAYRGARARGGAAAGAAGRAQLTRVRAAQRTAIAALPAGTDVLFRTHSVLSAVAVTTRHADPAALQQVPNVTGVHPIAPKSISNAAAVPLQGAPAAWTAHSQRGTGQRIAIIDSGIDYTHANFGGPGHTSDYDTAHAAEASAASPALFPNAKVAGGYDLVGDAYDAAGSGAALTPHPDPNPLDCGGHGSHVAGTAAGYGENADGSTYTGIYDTATPFGAMRIGPGVAPDAALYAYRVFGCSGSTNVVTEAIDRASDPNGDGNPSDGADVINMSLGSSYGGPDDGDAVAADAAVDKGITVAVSAGNDGDSTDVAGSPGTAAKVITVANSQDAASRVDGLHVTIDGTPHAYGASRAVLYDWSGPDLAGPVVRAPGDHTACSALPPGSLAGKVVLTDWHDRAPECGSVTRSGNLQAAGAIGFIFASDAETFSAAINGSAAIPGVLVAKSGGDALRAALDASGTVTATSTGANEVTQDFPADVDKLAPSSSRGIHAAGGLKPDVTAVGTSVFSAASGTGSEGASETGTSMAAPMVAGLAALVQGEHPAWTPQQVKADVMNTAGRDPFVGGGAAHDTPYAPIRVGAGRIEADAALDNDVLAYSSDDAGAVSVSFGPVEVREPTTLTKRITVENTGATAATYDVAYDAVTTVPGVTFSVSPEQVSVAPGGAATVTVTLSAPDPATLTKTVDPTIGRFSGLVDIGNTPIPRETLAEASGRVVLTPQSVGPPALRVPVYAAPRPTATMHQPAALAIAGGTAQATLPLSGADLGVGPANGGDTPDPADDIDSLAAGFALQATSGAAPACSVSITQDCVRVARDRAADIAYVGVTSDAPYRADPAGGLAYFAIATHGAWSTAANGSFLQVDIDVDGDATPDRYLYNYRLGSEDVFVAELVDTGNHVLDRQYVNGRTGKDDTALYDSDTMILPVSLAKLAAAGITPENPRITYGVEAFSGSTNERVDAIGVDAGHKLLPTAPTVDVYHPALTVTDAGGKGPLVGDTDGAALTVTRDLTRYRADGAAGLLMVHLHNAVGNKAQVVSLRTQGIAFTSTPPAAAHPGGTYAPIAAGGPSSAPVVFSSATPDVCTVAGAIVTFVAQGTCTIHADQAGDADYDAAATVTQSFAVTRIATAVSLTIAPRALVATVLPAAAGAPTGTVAFAVDGRAVGSVPLAGSRATLAYVTPPGATRRVTATYTGDGTFLGAPAAADRRDPRISARRSSTHEKTRYGWYRDPVTVRFTCAARGAPLVGGCPGKVVLRNNGAKRSVTRSVRAGDGGVGRATAAGINLDRTRPTVRISGPRSGHAYRRLPTARCVARDALSKVASCRIARRTTSRTARFTATATDKAGNVRTRTVTVRRR